MLRKIILQSLIILTLLCPTAFAQIQFSDMILTDGIWMDSRAYTSLTAAINAAGANETDIYIGQSETVTTLTIPANVRLHFFGDGALNNSGQVTIYTRSITAPNHQIFTGAGNLDFQTGTRLKSAWFANLESALALTTNDSVDLVISIPHTMTASWAVGNNVRLKWESPSCQITANIGITLSNISQPEAGDYLCFTGSGDFDFVDGVSLNLNWFQHLRSVVTYLGSVDATIIIPGTNDVDYTDTVPSNIFLDFVSRNGIFDIGAAVTLTINSPEHVIAGSRQQIFSGSGTADWTHPGTVCPEWWGENTTPGTTDMTAEWQAAITSVDSDAAGSGGVLKLNPGTYLLSDQITSVGNITIIGAGMQSTIVTTSQTDANSLLFFESSGNYVEGIVIKDIYFSGNGSSHTGGCIEFDSPYFATVENCFIYNFGGRAIDIYQDEVTVCQHVLIRNCKINYNALGGIRLGTTSVLAYYTTIDHCSINQNGYYGVFLAKADNTYITNCEFAGYYYGYTAGGALHQSVPIAINQASSPAIIACGFENNGGVAGTAGYNIRTGYNGDTQANTTNSTRSLIVMGCDFHPSQAANRDLTDIRLHYVIDGIIEGSHFEDGGLAGNFYAVEWGDLVSTSGISFRGNEYDTTLDNVFDGTESDAAIIWDDVLIETITTDAQTLQPQGKTDLDTTAGALAGTLPNGAYNGQTKVIYMDTDGGDYTLTVTQHETSNPEVFTFDDAGDCLMLCWFASYWYTVKNQGVGT